MASREEVLSIQEQYLKEVADAIRDKDGTNGQIAPIDFPSRIRAISTTVVGEGGGLPAGGSMNQALMKNSDEDGDVRWGNVVVTFNGRSGFVFPQEGDYTADDVGAVPTYRSVNNQKLESDIWLTAEDIGAMDGGEANQKFGAIDARFDNAESSIAKNTQAINDAKNTLSTEITTKISQAKTEILSQVKAGITYGTTALVTGVSSLETGTLYVQYEV